MRCSRMRGYGAWCQGWRDSERLPPGPPHKPGIFFWSFIGLVVFACIQVAAQGNPLALLFGLAILVGAIQGACK
jgi:hypothetical protein